MAQNTSGRKRTRRQAEQAAQAQAAAAQQAHDRRQQTMLGVIVILVIVALVAVAGFAIWRSNRPTTAADVQKAYETVQNVPNKPKNATDKGGFLISKDGLGKKAAGAPTVEVYMDFLCPGCGQFERTTGSTLNTMVQAGQLNLEIHPLAFLDRLSTDKYSTRLASMASYIAQHDPEHLLAFISRMYGEDVQPSESDYKPVSDDSLKKQALAAGVSQEVADQSVKGDYTEWINKLSAYTPLRQELWNVSGSAKGQMTTPTVRINGSYWDISDVNAKNIDYVTGIIKSLGLNSSDVGKSGVTPSIGSDGKPIAL